jgi:L-fucose isomerase-like protein
MVRRFKQRVVHESLFGVIEGARALKDDDPEVKNVLEDMRRMINVSQVLHEALLKMAKLEVVLRRLAKDRRLSGMGIRCWTEIQRYYGISPCFVMGRLTQSGIMSSCEVDIYGALTMLVQYEASLETTPLHFIDWTIQHPKGSKHLLSIALWKCPARACLHRMPSSPKIP